MMVIYMKYIYYTIVSPLIGLHVIKTMSTCVCICVNVN